MATTFISPDFTNRPYAPELNNNRNAQQNAPVAAQHMEEPVAKGGFTDFVKDNKVMVIIFVLVVVIVICILIWMMTREKAKPPAEAPGPPNQPRALPRGPLPNMPPQGNIPPQPQQGNIPPQQVQPPQPQQPPPQAAIETADDKELNRFMHLDEGSASEEEKRESFTISESDDESKHDNIEDSVSVESSNE